VAQHSFNVVKDSLVDHSLLKFIQSKVNWKTDIVHYSGILQWSYT